MERVIEEIYQEMEVSSDDNATEGSDVSDLVHSVHLALERFIESSTTTKKGSFIVKKDVFANVLHAFANLEEVLDDLPGDKPPQPSNHPSINDKVLERLTAIEKEIQRIQYARQPHPPRQPSWAEIAAAPLPPTVTTPRGRAITLRPKDKDNTFKGKETQEILKEVRMDLPGAVGVRPLRSGDIRVVLKDLKEKENAIKNGNLGGARILRQDFHAKETAKIQMERNKQTGQPEGKPTCQLLVDIA